MESGLPSSGFVPLYRRACAGVFWLGADCLAQSCISSTDESREPALQGPAIDQDVTRADLTAKPDVGAEPVDEPVMAAAGMVPAQSDHVPQTEIDYARSLSRHYGSLPWVRPLVTSITAAQPTRAGGLPVGALATTQAAAVRPIEGGRGLRVSFDAREP